MNQKLIILIHVLGPITAKAHFICWQYILIEKEKNKGALHWCSIHTEQYWGARALLQIYVKKSLIASWYPWGSAPLPSQGQAKKLSKIDFWVLLEITQLVFIIQKWQLLFLEKSLQVHLSW